LAECGIDEFHYDRFAGWRTADVFRAVFAESREPAVSGDFIADCARRKTVYARELLDADYPLVPLCGPIVRQLSERYRLALASSGSRASVESFLNHTGLDSCFESVLSGDEVDHAKPHPEIFEKSIRNIGLEPSGCAVVEDAVAGVQAARSAGAHVIGMGREFSRELTLAGAETIVGSLEELAGMLSVL
jgi:HAD superfamily hydrolase (TIGR01509 family)